MALQNRVLVAAAAVVLLLAAAGAGVALSRRSEGAGSVTSQISSGAPGVTRVTVAPEPALGSPDVVMGGGAPGVAPGAGTGANVGRSDALAGKTVQPMVVRTAAVEVRVQSVGNALAALRAIARAAGGQIESLRYTAGSPSPQPVPLTAGAASKQPGGPKSAEVVIRVPANKIEGAADAVAQLGGVVSQSAGQQDVTQQYVDIAARLANLKAEEARLRTFFTKANRVSDMLAIESQLAEVQGQIESMQAQADYLKRQAAMATLTVSLSEPGAIVSPSGSSWGFRDSVTAGVRAAAAVVNGAIFLAIAALPFVALGAAVWLVAWLLLRRRGASGADAVAYGEASATTSAK